MSKLKFSKCFLLLIFVLFSVQFSLAEKLKNELEKKVNLSSKAKKGRLPVIIIPGLVGSELVNKENGDTVWFSLGRNKDDDVRLPISPNLASNRDNLVPGDILRTVKVSRLVPGVKIYQSLIESLKEDGFTEGKIDDASETGFEDTFYVFPYDWRRDNVENAHLLIQKLDNIRTKVKRPNLKFNVIAHSMGGLLVRYAAMYGQTELSENMEVAVWKGESYFNNLSLVGTPNGGSVLVLDSLVNGFSFSGSLKINVPFVRDLTIFDVFTTPSIYQLLPHQGRLKVYNKNLEEIEVDMYKLETWKKYDWLAYTKKEFENEFTLEERSQAEKYFQAVLGRARQFQSALNKNSNKYSTIRIYNFGALCKPTVDGLVVYREKKSNKWKTLFVAKSFRKNDGTKVSKKRVKEVLVSPGDSQVSESSLNHSFAIKRQANQSAGNAHSLSIVCGHHSLLTEHKEIRQSILSVLNLPPNISTDQNIR